MGVDVRAIKLRKGTVSVEMKRYWRNWASRQFARRLAGARGARWGWASPKARPSWRRHPLICGHRRAASAAAATRPPKLVGVWWARSGERRGEAQSAGRKLWGVAKWMKLMFVWWVAWLAPAPPLNSSQRRPLRRAERQPALLSGAAPSLRSSSFAERQTKMAGVSF